MSDYSPRVGDRVRVVLEGEVRYTRGSYFRLADDQEVWSTKSVVSIEEIEPPVTVFQPGDVVRWHSDPPGKVVALGHTGFVELPRGSEGKYDDLTDGADWFNSRRYEKVNLSS